MYRAMPYASLFDANLDEWGQGLKVAPSCAHNDTATVVNACGAAFMVYPGGTFIYCGEVVNSQPDRYGILVVVVADAMDTTRSETRVMPIDVWTPCPRVLRFKWVRKPGSRFEGTWKRGTFVDGRCAFSHCVDSAFEASFSARRRPRATITTAS